MTTTDPKGKRGITTGNTPAAGMAALNAMPPVTPDGGTDGARDAGREVPKLSLVTPDYDAEAPEIAPYVGPTDVKATQQIAQVEGPADAAVPKTAAERIRQARRQSRAAWVQTNRTWLIVALAVVVALLAVGGGSLLMRAQPTKGVPTGAGTVPTAAATKPLPTPTGLGDATATPLATATTAAPPANVIGVNGWVQVQADSLVVREAPSRTAARVKVLANGTKAHVVDGPKDADGFTWWKIDQFDPKNPSSTGWSAGKFLAPIPPP